MKTALLQHYTKACMYSIEKTWAKLLCCSDIMMFTELLWSGSTLCYAWRWRDLSSTLKLIVSFINQCNENFEIETHSLRAKPTRGQYLCGPRPMRYLHSAILSEWLISIMTSSMSTLCQGTVFNTASSAPSMSRLSRSTLSKKTEKKAFLDFNCVCGVRELISATPRIQPIRAQYL